MSAPKVKPSQPVAAPTDATDPGAEPKIRRATPYPIDVLITKADNPAPFKGQILKLTEFGFLMRVEFSNLYLVGENCQIQFVIPDDGWTIVSPAKVIKTYDAMTVIGKNSIKTRTVEMHFKDLPPAERSKIKSYLVKTDQKIK